MSQNYSRTFRPQPSQGCLQVALVMALVIAGLLLVFVGLPLLVVWLLSGRGDVGGEAAVAPRAITARGSLAEDELATIALYENAAPSVVHITTLTRTRQLTPFGWFQSRERPTGTGSGFVWDEHGHIVTNFHVIEDATAAEVTLMGGKGQQVYRASLVGTYPPLDLAVLRIEAPSDQLRPIPLGTSSDLKVGQKVFAIGNPFGLDHTLTTGIISALNREITSVVGTPIRGVIQTDAAINPGNSGGPLLDSAGRLIGVNTAIYSPSGVYAGIGFAIPVDAVNEIVPRLIARKRGVVPEGGKGPSVPVFLGIVGATDQVAQQLGIQGIIVVTVEPDSPAAKAGIRPMTYDPITGRYELGDIIVALGSQSVRNVEELRKALRQYKAGDTVTVTVLRQGRRVPLQVELE